MQTVSGFRTRLLPQARAESFAKCLAARGQATDVQVMESRRTPNAACAHFVYWTPRSPIRQQALLDDTQNARARRAEEQRGGYQFILADSGRFHYCLSPAGEVYEVTTTDCDCPDKCFHLRGLGLQCKHSLMLEAYLAEAEALETERWIEEQWEQAEAEAHAQHLAALKAEAARAALKARMQEDFPD